MQYYHSLSSLQILPFPWLAFCPTCGNISFQKNGIYNTKHVEWILSWMATFDQAKENDWDDYTDYNFDITKDATALNQWYAKRKADLIRYNETKTEEQ